LVAPEYLFLSRHILDRNLQIIGHRDSSKSLAGRIIEQHGPLLSFPKSCQPHRSRRLEAKLNSARPSASVQHMLKEPERPRLKLLVIVERFGDEGPEIVEGFDAVFLGAHLWKSFSAGTRPIDDAALLAPAKIGCPSNRLESDRDRGKAGKMVASLRAR